MKIDLQGADRLALAHLQDFEERPKYLSIDDEKVDFSRLLADLDLPWRLGYRKRHYEGRDRLGRPISHRFERGASGPFGADLCDGYPRHFLRIWRESCDFPLIFRAFPCLSNIFHNISYANRVWDALGPRASAPPDGTSYRPHAFDGHQGRPQGAPA
jgi:hypothetical protein